MPRTDSAIYFDSAATTRVAPEVCAAMLAHLDGTQGFANASSGQHAAGRQAADLIERARADVATDSPAWRRAGQCPAWAPHRHDPDRAQGDPCLLRVVTCTGETLSLGSSPGRVAAIRRAPVIRHLWLEVRLRAQQIPDVPLSELKPPCRSLTPWLRLIRIRYRFVLGTY